MVRQTGQGDRLAEAQVAGDTRVHVLRAGDGADGVAARRDQVLHSLAGPTPVVGVHVPARGQVQGAASAHDGDAPCLGHLRQRIVLAQGQQHDTVGTLGEASLRRLRTDHLDILWVHPREVG
ncbi:hypothetical protein ABZY09_14390 [Streptomyces sp. NPDC002928]|uniref:hypothetical protein n=1 Tax=Streptomyces sp. NPDC002928 TaxID=3154440 RepID=UPI0033A307CD